MQLKKNSPRSASSRCSAAHASASDVSKPAAPRTPHDDASAGPQHAVQLRETQHRILEGLQDLDAERRVAARVAVELEL